MKLNGLTSVKIQKCTLITAAGTVQNFHLNSLNL